MMEETDLDLTSLADAAFRRAAKKVIERALNSGTPVIVWEEGEVKEVDPRTLLPSGKRKPRPRKRES